MTALKRAKIGGKLGSVWKWLNKRRTAPADSVVNAAPSDLAIESVDKEAVGKYWSEAQRIQDPFSPEVYWLANPRVNERYRRMATRGASGESWYCYAARKYLGAHMPVGRMLSIGCGAGGLEFDLAKLNAFQSCDAWDLAAGSIERAQARAEKEKVAGLHFAVRDAETSPIPARAYDAVWFNMSLHHIGELEKVLSNTARGLKPEGLLFLNEYVGPNRFDFSAREKEVMGALFRLLPDKYRRSFAQGSRGQVIEAMTFPDPAEVFKADPSESIRSADIIATVREFFDIVEWNPCGGTLLQFLLGNIMGNFREDDPVSLKLLRLLFDAEDALIAAHDIPSHFAVVIARPKA